MSKREKVLLALLGSILVHGILLMVLALCAQVNPAALASTQPIQLEIVPDEPPPAPTPLPELPLTPLPPEIAPPMINTTERQKSDRPPEKADFQSDKDTLAASEAPATSDNPLPSQQGKKKTFLAFDTHPYTPGDKPAEDVAPPAPAQPPKPPAPPETAPPRPEVNRAAPRSTPAPASTPAPTPTPEPTPEPDVLAMLAPTPTPAPMPPPDMSTPSDKLPLPTPFDFTVRQTLPPLPKPAVVPNAARRSAAPGYQPQTETNYISGGVSNRGIPAPSALGTPLGRYRKAVSDAIGSRWYFRINENADQLVNGTVKIHFTVDRSGKVRSPKVVSQSGRDVLATFSLQAIMEAQLPPIPPEVVAVINSNQLEIDYDFLVE
jgi:outer membrane biosynthesis protein TonB